MCTIRSLPCCSIAAAASPCVTDSIAESRSWAGSTTNTESNAALASAGSWSMNGTLFTGIRFCFEAPGSWKIRPKITMKNSGKKIVKKTVSLSRMVPLNIATASARNAIMRGTPVR